MAPATKPTTLKLVTGTARPGRLNPAEPKPEIKIPSCPAGLSSKAKSEWRRIASVLEDQGLLSEMDRSALAAYCEIYGRWMESLAEIEKNGMTFVTPNGSVQVSPFLSIARYCEKEIRQFCGEFGMTPASRSKVDATPKKENEDDDFFD